MQKLTHCCWETLKGVHRQTVQTQIRCRIMRHLIRVSTANSHFSPEPNKPKKITPNTPQVANGLFQYIRVENSTRLQWVNIVQFFVHDQFWIEMFDFSLSLKVSSAQSIFHSFTRDFIIVYSSD